MNYKKILQYIYEHSPTRFQNYMITRYSLERRKKKYGQEYFEFFNELTVSQWFDNQKLQLLQNFKLNKVVSYAVKNIPYYKSMFKENNLHAEDIETVRDLKKIPFLTKDQARNYVKQLISNEYKIRSLEHFQTSGTTGKAIDVYASSNYIQMEKAFQWLHRSWGGVKMGDRQATFVGYSVVPFNRTRPPFWVYDNVENRIFFSLHHMTKENLKYYINHLNEIKPDYIVGYPMAIFIISSYILDGNPVNFKPKAIFTASETLMPYQKPIIESAFHTRIFDWYGQTEFTANIVQCEEGNYHIKYEYGVVEILNSEGEQVKPGEAGEIVATGLNNLAMPFIRYRTGDTAIFKGEGCSCGRGGLLVERIIGRVEDVIITPDGRMITRLDFLFKGLNNVREAQLYQDEIDHLYINVVPSAGYSEFDKRKILAHAREHIGEMIKIEIREVDEIPRTKNGKFKYVVSDVFPKVIGLKQSR